MATECARGIAAQAWCTPTTEKIVMDPVLAEAFAEILDNLGKDTPPEQEQPKEE